MQLTKHHGLGNDFLVLLDLDDAVPVDGATARALCDRRRGVGADGFIRATPGTGGADVTMTLWNADGSRAETSGNGLRCLAQAVVDAGLVAGELTVATAAGVKQLVVGPESAPGLRTIRVDMGPARDGGPTTLTAPAPVTKTAMVDMGNPHLVCLVHDVNEHDGLLVDRDLNVELVAEGPGADALTMRVWERGVGETPACGTGSCAAAWAAREWGLVGPHVAVHQPGGVLQVTIDPDTIHLTGPTQRIATITVDLRSGR